MKITTYQQNAQMLSEAHRMIHQQNMKRLAELTRQAEQQQRVQEIKTQWAKSVDIKAGDTYCFFCCSVAAKMFTAILARTLITFMHLIAKSLNACLLRCVQNT